MNIRLQFILLLSIHIVPFLISVSMCNGFSFDYEGERNWFRRRAIPLSILLNLLFIPISFALAFHKNPLLLLDKIRRYELTYQDFARMATANLLCLLFAVFLAYSLCVFLLHEPEKLVLRKRGKLFLLAWASLMAAFAFVGYQTSYNSTKKIELAGVCRKASNFVFDYEDSKYVDQSDAYILINNTGDLPIEADAFYLSDELEIMNALKLNQVVLYPNQPYRYDLSSAGPLNIKKKGGTYLFFYDQHERLLSTVSVPTLKKDELYRKEDGEWIVEQIIPEAVAAEEDGQDVAPPVFSAESGFYDTTFSLTLEAEPGTTIYYTTDCTDPEENGTVYNSAIQVYDRTPESNQYRNIDKSVYVSKYFTAPENVDKCFVVRAIAIDEAGNRSQPVTKSYFVNKPELKDIMVVSLVSDPKTLFDEETGIYVTGREYDAWFASLSQSQKEQVDNKGNLYDAQGKIISRPYANFERKGKDWERPANVELFKESSSILNQMVGIRIQGGSNRIQQIKRFSLFARKEYSGSRLFDIPLWNDLKMHSLVLREGFNNSFTPMLVTDRDVAVQASIPVKLFLDGEFWADTYISEKYNQTFFANYYNLQEENVYIVKKGIPESMGDSRYNSLASLAEFVSTSDFSDPEAYEELCRRVDIQSYIDFLSINIYLGNMDEAENKNVVMWHTNIKEDHTYGDGRWRWALFDMDLLRGSIFDKEFSKIPKAEVNTFKVQGGSVNTSYHDQVMFTALRKNKDFCKQFVLTFMDLANYNFSEKKVQAVLSLYGEDLSIDKNYYQLRGTYITEYLADEFGLKGTREKVTISSDKPGTPVRLNTILPELEYEGSGYNWSGYYYTDYPVVVSAEDADFSYFEVTINGDTRRYYDKTIEVPVEKGGVQIYASFK